MKTIALLETIAEHAAAYRQHLEKHHFNVLLSSDIPGAKKIITEQTPHMLVIDLNLPAGEFPGFYRWLIETPAVSKLPRVFISGKQQTPLAEQLKSKNRETVLKKPVNIDALVRALTTGEKSKSTPADAQQDYLSSFPGKKVGSAVIREEIGRGGMGAVFLGFQESLNRQVAVKILLPGMVGDAAAVERFKREARAIAQLKSPHIVQVYDFAELENHTLYIVMEYLPGETIESYLDRFGRFPIEKAVSVISQVARGLSVAHDAGLVHRDIKPSNLIMNSRGHVTITDFGLVKAQKSAKQTQTGTIFGTPQFISPEQVAGKPQDPRSDIYSLGIVFYKLLTGELPFNAGEPLALIMQHLNEPLPDPREMISSIPPQLAETLKRMAAKDPEHRYINCRELLWELEALDLKETAARYAATGKEASPPAADFTLTTGFNREFLTLEKHFPTLFTRERLLGVMTLTQSGAILDQDGRIPEKWENIFHILYESTKQLNAAAGLGEWHFTVTGTPEEVAVLFPREAALGSMVFNQKETTLSSQSIKTPAAFPGEHTAAEPLKRISSIAGVIKALLFNAEGGLVESNLKESAVAEQYTLRFSPVTQIVRSIDFVITDIDIWFEKGRILLWKLDSGMLFLITTLDVSKSFLSIFVLAHLPQLNTSTKSIKVSEPPETEAVQSPAAVDNPVPAKLFQGIQLELAKIVGPIAKVLLDKEIKKMGYVRRSFPEERLQDLVKRLTALVGESKQQHFSDKIQDLIYDSRREE